jgi:outer membrane lipoprotein-sorting protein
VNYRNHVLLVVMLLCTLGIVRADELPQVLVETQGRCERFLAAAQDMTVVQEMLMADQGDTVISIQTIYRRGADSRTDMRITGPGGELAGMPTTVVTHNGTTTMVTPMGSEQLSPEEAADYEPERICWEFANHEASIVGTETIDGHECDVVELVEDGQHYRLNVDKNRYLVLGGELVSEDGDRLHWHFSDFELAAYDFELPRRIEMFAGDAPISTLRVKSVNVNSGLSDDIFDPAKVEMPTTDELMKQMLGGTEQK